jgi:hypothetical protein
VRPLVIPPAMPRTAQIAQTRAEPIDYYEIAVRRFKQQILPNGQATTVWSYGSVNHSGTFNYPAFTLEARWMAPVRVKWINGLVDGSGNYLPHLLPVDRTLHWANPPGGTSGRDMRPTFESTPGPYTGPVPIVTHLHGGHTSEESDGYAEAWYLPGGVTLPGYATVGSKYDQFRAKSADALDVGWDPGSAVFQCDNDQRATTMWYHDHTLGMTRLNVCAVWVPETLELIEIGPSPLRVGFRFVSVRADGVAARSSHRAKVLQERCRRTRRAAVQRSSGLPTTRRVRTRGAGRGVGRAAGCATRHLGQGWASALERAAAVRASGVAGACFGGRRTRTAPSRAARGR